MQKQITTEMPSAAKKRVTDRLQGDFDNNCIKFCDAENENLLNKIRTSFEKDMRDALKDVSSSQIDQAVNIAKLLGEASLSELNPCNIDYDTFKVLKKNKVGQGATGDYALKYDDYQNLSKTFQNEAKDIFLKEFLNKIRTTAEDFKNDIKLLEQKKQAEQDALKEEVEKKKQDSINQLTTIDSIFQNRVGRGVFKLFGGGKPSLKALLIEVGCTSSEVKDITDKDIDKAKPKLIEKFKDAKTAESAFTTACQNQFNRQVFDRLAEINDKNSQLINKSENLTKENQEMKAEIEAYKKGIKSIEELSDGDMTKQKISQILQTMKIVHQTKLQGDEDAKDLINKFNQQILGLEEAMKAELNTQTDTFKAKLEARKKKKNAITETQVQDDKLQSRELNRLEYPKPQPQNVDFYAKKDQSRPVSALSQKSNVESLVESKRNSQSSQGY